MRDIETDMSAIEITCPQCNAKTLVSQEDLGHEIDCPSCGESFEAPLIATRSKQKNRPTDGGTYEADDFMQEMKASNAAFSIEDRVNEFPSAIGGADAVESATDILKDYILKSEGEVPVGRDLLHSELTLNDDPDFYSVTESIWRKSRGTVHLLWRGREVVKVDFDCEYEKHSMQIGPSRDMRRYEEDYDAYSDQNYLPDNTDVYERRVRKNGRASFVQNGDGNPSNSARAAQGLDLDVPAKMVEGLEDVLRQQKARVPKQDKWADFEEPKKGRKMTCWRCHYRGRSPEQKRSIFEALLGFRVPVCPRCKAVNSQPLPILTRIIYHLGSFLFLFMGGSALFNAFQYLLRDSAMTLSSGAATLGVLTGAAIPVTIFFLCVNALAKDRAIRSAKKK